MRLSMRWAARSREAFVPREGYGLFGIVQGSIFPDLRAESVAALTADRLRGLCGRRPRGRRGPGGDVRACWMPPRRCCRPAAPRYLMGVGTPGDLVGAVRRGIDMFDCVMPTRSGRTGRAYTSRGVLNLRNARHAEDPGPLDPDCGCPACTRHSRAYIHHLLKAEEMLGPMLLTWHNIQYYQDLMRGLRQAICEGRFEAHAAALDAGWAAEKPAPEKTRRKPMSSETNTDTSGLTLLGRTAGLPDSPGAAVLERVPNPHPGMRYCVRFTAPEFTTLCPLTGQPDFAHLVIDYVPGEWLVESKSLKLYLSAFRNHGAFHEDCTVGIARRLVAEIAPAWLRIGGYWYPRGGIPIDVFWQTGAAPDGVWVPDQGVPPYRGRG